MMISPNEKNTHMSLPIGWSWQSLGEITTFSQYGISSSSGDDCIVPIVKMNNLTDGHIDLSNLDHIKLSKAEMENLVLYKGDLLINRTNSYDLVGKAAVYDVDGTHVYASYLVRFRLSPSVIPAFVCYYLNSGNGQHSLRRLATKAISQANINPSTLKKQMFIPIAPLPEQSKIVEILSTWDHAIDLTSQLIAAKQQRKRGLMQQLLTGKKRFQEYINIPWQSLRAGDIFQPNSKRNNGDEELLSVTQDRGVIPRSMLETRVVMPAGETASYKLVEVGDFIISLRSFQGGIEYSEYQGLVSPAYTVLKPMRPIVDSFYKHLFKSQNFISRLAVAIIGIRDGKQINFEDFASIRLAYPDLDEQKRIAEVLDTCDQELALLNRKLALLKKQKQGLMQQLLTGKIQVKT